MKPKDNDEYFLPFKGAKLNKGEANQTGFGIIAGLIGIALPLMIFGTDHKFYSLMLVIVFAVLGYFGYGYVKKRKKAKKT